MDGGSGNIRERDGKFLAELTRSGHGELDASEIQTEIFLLPASLPGEKEGTFTNTHRLIQWHDKVVDPPGDTRSDLWFFHHLGVRLKELYAGSADPRDEPIKSLTWDYPTEGPHQEPSAEAVLREINGFTCPLVNKSRISAS